jgi:hypothetical protein
LSFIPSFLFLERFHCCCYYIYIFTAPTCTISFSWGWLEWRSHGLPTLVTIITLEPCASNSGDWEAKKSNKNNTEIFPYFADTTERGERGEGGGVKERVVTLWITLLGDSDDTSF